MREAPWLWQRLREERRLLALGVGLGLLTGLATVGLMTVGGSLLAITALTGLAAAGTWSPTVGKLSAAIRLFAILRTVGRYGERVLTHEATFRVLARLRQWFFARLAPLAPARLQALRGGDLLDRLVADVEALGGYYVRVLAPFAWSLAVALAVGGFLALLEVRLGISCGALLLVAVVGLPRLGQAAAEALGAAIADQGRVLRVRLLEALQGRLELQVYGAAEAERRGLEAEGQRWLALQGRYARRVAGIQALGVLLSGSGLLVALWLGAAAVQGGRLAPEQLAAAVLALFTAFEVVAPLALAFPERGRVRAAAGRVQHVLEGEPGAPGRRLAKATPGADAALASISAPTPVPDAPRGQDLRLHGVALRYPGAARAALADVDLTVPAGERLAVLGPSGAGKTSLVQLLLRFWEPTAGRLSLGGVDLGDLAEVDLRRLVTAVPQRPHLLGGTLGDNLRLARPGATDAELEVALGVVQLGGEVAAWPEGLDTWLRGSGDALDLASAEPGDEGGDLGIGGGGDAWGDDGDDDARAWAVGRPLSGGQARRVALARAVLRDARVIVLDEPTADLDPDMAARLMAALDVAFAGRTLIVVTHDRRVAERMDRVVVLEAGRVVELGPPAALRAAGGRFAALTPAPGPLR